MICGIYKITNLINGHYYIGQSVDIKGRFRGHRFSAMHITDKDHNTPIHLAMYKYGCDNFSYEILEQCPRDRLNEREIYWIDLLQACDNGNYNILRGGQDRKKFDEKPVELYDLTGKYIKTIASATKTAEELGVSRNSVYGALYQERPTCRGYQLKYQEDTRNIQPFRSRQGGSKRVRQIDPMTNNIIATYHSVNEAARTTGADSSTISKVCRGKLKTHYGYKWQYEEC